jgi:tetratricopeptide (TPR) repeat protein
LSADRQSQPAEGFPDLKQNPEVWQSFFAKTKPSNRLVEQHATYLVDQQQHEHLIAYLNAAIIAGQTQPWMYEVLAVTMELAHRPPEEVERVVLSMADFGNASYESMMYSGAYLSNLGRDRAALRMYRQAAQMSPDRPEPYSLSMKLAAREGTPDDAIWAACGVLRNAWGIDHKQQHERAEDLLKEAEKSLRKTNDEEQLAKLQQLGEEARQRDLVVRVEWSGTGDIDLTVEDPAGGIATYETRESAGGGTILNDGYGSIPNNCFEDYVCPLGFSGEYVIKVKKFSEKVVGNRAVLTMITHAGTSTEKKTTKTIKLDTTDEFVMRIKLDGGRREHRRTAYLGASTGVSRDWEREARQVGRSSHHVVDRETRQAVAEMHASGRQPVIQAGGVGFAPGISLIQEGSTLSTRAVVSPDRRYVRIGISPAFNQITDVSVFSFLSGGGVGRVPGRSP